MIREALEYVADKLAPATKFAVLPGEEDSTLFDRKTYRTPDPRPVPLAKPLEVATLRSLADYVAANVDRLALGDHLIHVVSPERVELISRLETFHRQREVVLAAFAYASPAARYLDQWMDLETATIALMATFTGQGDRDYTLELLKSITRDKAEVREDNGMSQKVTVAAGVVTKSAVTTKNPIVLAPFRTFAEVEQQPESLFVLRLRDADGIGVLLKLADGFAWKVDAVERVALALKAMLPEGAPNVIY